MLKDMLVKIESRMQEVDRLKHSSLFSCDPLAHPSYKATLEDLLATVLAQYVVTGKLIDITVTEVDPVPKDLTAEKLKAAGFTVSGDKEAHDKRLSSAITEAQEFGFDPEDED